MPNDSIWSRAYRTPFAGPYSAQAIAQGVGDAIGQPLANDARAIKRVRNQYPTIDTLASLHPLIAGAQVANDIAAGDTGFDTAANIVQMIPAVKPLGLLAKQKAANFFGRRWGVDMPATLRRNAIITSGQVLGQTNDAE